MVPMRDDLLALFDTDELKKYYTEAELPPGRRGDGLMGEKVALRVWRGDAGQGELTDYQVEANEGEVLLDVLHRLQATQAGDLAIRWNCKAGKCGSCSMEINGRPRLACMTRMSHVRARTSRSRSPRCAPSR